MKRKWTAVGFYGLVDFDLDGDARKHLTAELKNRHKITFIPEEFFSEISMAIARFLSGRVLHEECKPAVVRRNLQVMLDISSKLKDKVMELDGNSRNLIEKVIDDDDISLRVLVNNLVGILNNARKMADEFPTRGALYDSSKSLFARDIADIIDKHLGKRATTTKGGIYESVLTITLEAATKKTVSSVHDLCRKGLKIHSTYSLGLTEYTRQEDD